MDKRLTKSLLAFGANVKLYRTAKGETLESLGNKIGTDRFEMSRIESGKRDVGLSRLLSIASALDVYPHVLLP